MPPSLSFNHSQYQNDRSYNDLKTKKKKNNVMEMKCKVGESGNVGDDARMYEVHSSGTGMSAGEKKGQGS